MAPPFVLRVVASSLGLALSTCVIVQGGAANTDGDPDPDGDLASITVPMTAGQTITVVVESSSIIDQDGTFDLDVTML